ncbi:MAG TPA: cytochrome c-type biogenesis protein [Rhizomicrobium sp.]|nr:cytochrome c-type biogenesis protein [Rhizomicrobium sp.]
MMRAFFFAIFAAFITTAALADADRLSNPVQEARAVQLQKQFRCLVCQGESLDESNAQLAADLRRLIRAKIAAGESDQQIKSYLVSRYGDFILMKPPLEPGTWLLWFGPLAVLLLGGGIAAMVVIKARKQASAENP